MRCLRTSGSAGPGRRLVDMVPISERVEPRWSTERSPVIGEATYFFGRPLRPGPGHVLAAGGVRDDGRGYPTGCRIGRPYPSR